MKSGRK